MDKAFRHLLQEKRDAIATRWRELVLATYPSDSAQFLAREKDPFSNPVGQTYVRVLGPMLDELIGEQSPRALDLLLDDVMRIRAVQAFLPSKAVGVFFSLKTAVREELQVSKLDKALLAELLVFETRIDALMCRAFDAYMGCREKLYEIKANEIRHRQQRVIEALNERVEARYRAEKESNGSESSQTSTERGDTR